jgi:hypothetical protein
VSDSTMNFGYAKSSVVGAEELFTYEDVLRARDRLKVLKSRAAKSSLRLLWLLAGPGVLVMIGENDGPSMVSYATTGATYGIGFFVPFVLLTFLMAYVVQEMTVRLGVATHRGHSELIFQRFGPFWGYFAMADLLFGNLLTLVTEFIAIQAGGLYFGVPAWASVAIGVALVIGSLAFRRYATWERMLMGLAAFNLLFVPAALLAHPDGAQLTHALATWGPVPGGFTTAFLTLVLANVGATVTPWMIFFQQSAVVDKGLTRADVPQGRTDTAIGADRLGDAAGAAGEDALDDGERFVEGDREHGDDTPPWTTNARLFDSSPAMMTSPRPLAATVEPIAAVASAMTADSRTPSRITGSASGASTVHSRCVSVMPMPLAASTTSGGRVVRPVTAFSKIGSRP